MKTRLITALLVVVSLSFCMVCDSGAQTRGAEAIQKLRSMPLSQLTEKINKVGMGTALQMAQQLDPSTLSAVFRVIGPDRLAELTKQIAGQPATSPQKTSTPLTPGKDELRPPSPPAVQNPSIPVTQPAKQIARQPATSPRETSTPLTPGKDELGPPSSPAVQNPQIPVTQPTKQIARQPATSPRKTSTPLTPGKDDLDFDLDSSLVVVNPSNPVAELTPHQLQNLVTGAYKNWQEVGGPDLPVKVISPRNVDTVVSGFVMRRGAMKMIRHDFSSVAIPLIAQDKGALAIMPISSPLERRFISCNKYHKKIVVDLDQRS